MNLSSNLRSIVAKYVAATILTCNPAEQNIRLAHCAALGVAPRDALYWHNVPRLEQVKGLFEDVETLSSEAGALLAFRNSHSWLFLRDAIIWAISTCQRRLWAHDQSLPQEQRFVDWGNFLLALSALLSVRLGDGCPLLNDGRAPAEGFGPAARLMIQLANDAGVVLPQQPAASIGKAWAARKEQIRRSKAFSAFYEAEAEPRTTYLVRMKDRVDAHNRVQAPAAVELAVRA